MPDKVLPGPIQEDSCIREAVCIHTQKIFDSCKDKDCIEDLRLYPTRESLAIIDNAVSIRARSAKLLHVGIEVEEITFNRGFYTVDLRFFYKIKGEALIPMSRPVEFCGLAVFDKRVILFGSEGNAKTFTSKDMFGRCCHHMSDVSLPAAVVEAVDPIVLGIKLVDKCDNSCAYECCVAEIPEGIAASFDCDLVFDSTPRRVLVTLGQFSIIRMQRDTQLLIPSYDYCMPEKECIGGSEDDPCSLFAKIRFPVDEFFPPDTLETPDGYREVKATIQEG